jgi:hypothetical protein
MTMEVMTILTYCDGDRREMPAAPVVLTRTELGLLGGALGWPEADVATGGQRLAAAAKRYRPALQAAHLGAPDGDWWSGPPAPEDDTGDSGYWLGPALVRRIFATLSDPAARAALLAQPAARDVSEDRLIVCLQLLSQAVRRGMGVHFAHYLC